MLRLRFVLSIIIISILLSAAPSHAEDSPAAILAAMDSLEKKLEWANYRLAEEKWENYRFGRSDSLSFYNDLYLYVISSTDIYQYSKSLGNLAERADRQRLQILLSEITNDRIEMRPAIKDIKDSLTGIVDSYTVDFQGESKTLDDVKDLYHNSRSRSQRELGCKAWYSIGENLAPGMKKLINERNDAASKLGFDNYWDFISTQFSQNGVDLLQFIKAVDSLTQTGYSEFIVGSRSTLGINQMELWDVEFTHSQINQHGDSFFPADSHLAFIRRGLKSAGFTLEQLPIFIESVPRNPLDFGTLSFAIRPPNDIRILSESKSGFQSLHSLLSHSGIALYSAFIAQERPLYSFAADTTWQLAMGEIIGAMVYDSIWLNDVANMPLGFISQFRRAKLEEETIKVRKLLTNISFIFEAYTNPDRDLNQLYWDLYQKYTGLSRHDDIIIWATEP
ncbi:MAG TPA: hypothetical protein VHP63_08230, partial [candidate division Zixibacteria bacterium]|nr:hypothetical protein [candidate division Zixibacteria bacterium]